MSSRHLLVLLVTFAVTSALSCSDEGEGAVSFTTYGEDFIEKEIPEGDVADGWAIRYDRFLVAIGEVRVAVSDAPPAAAMTDSKLFDMKVPGEKLVVSFTSLPAKAYDRVSYEIGPATATTDLGVGVTDADRAFMTSHGYGIYLEAVATKAEVTKRLAWGFSTRTLYDRCRSEEGGREIDGVVVTTGLTAAVELTIHGDHFFYDDLRSADAVLRFDAFAAADADADGTITLDELSAVKLAALPRDGGPYGTGSATGIHDLRAYVEALSRTVGHFRGEGECLPSAR